MSPPERPARRRLGIRLTLVIATILVLAGGWWWSGGVGAGDLTTWNEVQRRDLVLDVEVTGALRSVDTSVLSPPSVPNFWEFKISFMAPEGADVVEGTPVLGFDDSELRNRLETQRAEAEQAGKEIERTEQTLEMTRRQDEMRLAEARATMRKAEMKMDMPETMVRGKELRVARLDLELSGNEVRYLERRLEASRRSAEATLAALRDQRDRAVQQVQDIQSAMERMMVKAPRDGTVVYAVNWNDEKKQVGDGCWMNESVMEVPDLDKMLGEGKVDEAEAGRLQEDQPVTLRLDAHPDSEFSGRVASIWKTVRQMHWRDRTKYARLEIELDETDTQKMRPGMRFRGKVETDRVSDALLLPIDAVFVGPDGPVVQRRTLFGYESVDVELGRRNSRWVEALGGVAEGDEVSLVRLDRDESGG